MTKEDKKPVVRSNSLGYLERSFFLKGTNAEGNFEAADDFEKVFTRPFAENFYTHLRRDSGVEVARTDASGIENVHNVHYESFDPPSFWNSPYQLMRVKVGRPKPKVFYYHPGEEFVLPIEGEGVCYDFFWTEPDSRKLPEVYPSASDPVVVRERQAIRIQPQIPHRAWGAGRQETDAWMITRPLENEAGQIYVAQSDRVLNQSNSRQVELTELQKNLPGHYPLLAWGISEEIRLKRLRTNRTIADVAAACEIDSAHLSRIEKGLTNVNLETLVRLFQELDINVARVAAPPREAKRLGIDLQWHDGLGPGPTPVFEEPEPRIELVFDPIPRRLMDHFIHPQLWQFPANSPQSLANEPNQWPTTWVIIQGRVLVDIEFGDRKVTEVLDKDGVLHVRENGAKINNVVALEDSLVLQILFDHEHCVCQRLPKKKGK
jgi:transcriptional regulator with XRE-family HTH domain